MNNKDNNTDSHNHSCCMHEEHHKHHHTSKGAPQKGGNMIRSQRATLERFIHALCTRKSVHLGLARALYAAWGLNLKL